MAGEKRLRAESKTDPPKRIVAMGDGAFSGGFLKKTFARELGMRGPTLIADEFATSRECPCGLCQLEDVPPARRTLPIDASRRPRRHTGSNRPSSSICCAIKPFTDRGLETDRDEFACMCLLPYCGRTQAARTRATGVLLLRGLAEEATSTFGELRFKN
jgi:hypothetical protein